MGRLGLGGSLLAALGLGSGRAQLGSAEGGPAPLFGPASLLPPTSAPARLAGLPRVAVPHEGCGLLGTRLPRRQPPSNPGLDQAKNPLFI